MIKALRWIAVLLVAYFGYTEFIPWVRGRVEGVTEDKIVGREESVAGGPASCVRLASQLSELVVDESRNAVPPPEDSSGWVQAGDVIRQRMAEVENECTCDAPACRTATLALGEIAALVDDLDLLISGQEQFSGWLVQRQDRINTLLDRARVQAR